MLLLRFALLIVLLVTTSNAGAGQYIVMDGQAYSVGNGAPNVLMPLFIISPSSSMSQCSRPGGSQPPSSSYQIYYGPTYAPLNLTAMWDHACFTDGIGRTCALLLSSSSGDVRCAGNVEVPAIVNLIFSSGFEQFQPIAADNSAHRLPPGDAAFPLCGDRHLSTVEACRAEPPASVVAPVVFKLRAGNRTWCVPVPSGRVQWRASQPIVVETKSTDPQTQWVCP